MPPLSASWTNGDPADARLQWVSTDETRVERRPAGVPYWAPVGDWRAAGSQDETHLLNAAQAWEHRLRVRRSTGAVSVGPAVLLDHL